MNFHRKRDKHAKIFHFDVGHCSVEHIHVHILVIAYARFDLILIITNFNVNFMYSLIQKFMRKSDTYF